MTEPTFFGCNYLKLYGIMIVVVKEDRTHLFGAYLLVFGVGWLPPK